MKYKPKGMDRLERMYTILAKKDKLENDETGKRGLS